MAEIGSRVNIDDCEDLVEEAEVQVLMLGILDGNGDMQRRTQSRNSSWASSIFKEPSEPVDRDMSDLLNGSREEGMVGTGNVDTEPGDLFEDSMGAEHIELPDSFSSTEGDWIHVILFSDNQT
uniref:Uncharacterized protein n=1 Tax=Moniliophthora roreri TaxID=221103 RepID=A0A0W0G9N5_MONRR